MCSATVTWSLLSYDQNSGHIMKCEWTFEILPFHCCSIIHMTELFNPKNKLIRNNTFILKLTINVTEVRGREYIPISYKNNEDAKRELESLFDRPISSTMCGHIFCTACITRSISHKIQCPSCRRDTYAIDLRPVYLPQST